METKANYLLIGAFTILGFLGILGFFAWFSKIELDRQYAYYDVYFPNVSGLDRASTVKFAGLAVGQVVDLRLSEAGDGNVRVRLEVDAATPVRIDSEATIEAQGVTGVSFVGISSGDPASALLARDAADGAPDILAGKSALQTLTEDAPRVIDETLRAIEQINAFLSDENRGMVEQILQNLNSASSDLDKALQDFSTVTDDVGRSVSEISSFTGELEGITDSVDKTLEIAESALTTIDDFADKATETLDAGTAMLVSADRTVTVAGDFIESEFTTAIEDLTLSSAVLREQMESVGGQASALITTWTATGSETTGRLQDLEGLLEQTSTMITDLTRTLDTIDRATASFDTLVTSEGALLMAEARNTVATADKALTPIADSAETQIPAILDDIRAATQQVDKTVAQLGADLTRATGRVDGLSETAQTALTEVTDTFTRARETLAAMESALSVAEGTLASADRAFDGADKVINRDIEPLTTQLSGTVDRLNRALDQVSGDLPAITGDLRQAAARASAAAQDLTRMLNNAEGPIDSFVEDGLPQYTQLADEARTLVREIEAIVARIERDPARFITGGSTPEYRR